MKKYIKILSLLWSSSVLVASHMGNVPFAKAALPARFVSKAVAAQGAKNISYVPVKKIHTLNNDRIDKDILYGFCMIQNIRGGGNRAAYPCQDRVLLAALLGKAMFAVCDGHGISGDTVAQEVVEQLPVGVLNNKDVAEGFKRTCGSLQQRFLKTSYAQRSGTTLVGAVFSDDTIAKKKVLTVANVGDSRLIVIRPSRQSIPFSTIDHKSANRASGLALSRSLGDVVVHQKYELTSEPETQKMSLENNDVVIIASDGYWDVVSNNETYDFVMEDLQKNISCDALAQHLAEIARIRASKDDITVVCVRYKIQS